MPVSPAYRPEPRFFDLGADYADAVQAADFPQTILRFRNDRTAASVGLDALSDAEKAAINEAAKETEAWKADNDAAQAETKDQGRGIGFVSALAWPGALRQLERKSPGYDV